MSRTSVEVAYGSTEAPGAHDVTPPESIIASPQGETLRPQDSSRTQSAGFTLGHPPEDPGHESTPASRTKRSKAQIATVMTCLCACVFLAALEVTIVTTALPTIASHFGSDSGYTWIGTAYVLAHTASTPSWGKISDIWGRKPILLIANAIFFGGSLMCAVVDNLKAFIAGRAIQGLGAAGLQTMVNICISDLFSLRDRGLWYGLTSLVWAVASGVGPVIGGAFTAQVKYAASLGDGASGSIAIPIAAVVFVLLVFTLKLDSPKTPVWAGLRAIDWSGSFFIIGGTLMLLLGLYLGGVYEPWNSAQVICLILFGFLTGALFVYNEWKIAEYPVIPVHLFRTWSSAAAYAVCFFHAFVFMGVAYYLPLYFQAVLLASPLKSGLYLLPLILSISLTAAGTGAYIQMTGKYMPAVYTGMIIMTLGTGLFIDIDFDSNWAKIIAFQIVTGMGVGMNFEGPLLAVQAVVPTQDVATATAAMSFIRTLSTAVSIVIGGVVFQNEIKSKQKMLVDELGPELAQMFNGASASAHVDVIKTLPPNQQVIVKEAFFQSLKTTWIMYVAFASVGLVLAFFIRAHHLSQEEQHAQLGLTKKRDAPNRNTNDVDEGPADRDGGIELAATSSVRARR